MDKIILGREDNKIHIVAQDGAIRSIDLDREVIEGIASKDGYKIIVRKKYTEEYETLASFKEREDMDRMLYRLHHWVQNIFCMIDISK